jgi:uncharacterized protein
VNATFVDTSAFYALTDRRDRNHEAARKALARLARSARELITTTDIFHETVTLVRHRLGHTSAVALGERLMASDWCRIIEVSEALRQSAWEIFVRYSDQSFSLTDCTSFATMRSMHIDEAFTFDKRDFAAAGFTPLIG